MSLQTHISQIGKRSQNLLIPAEKSSQEPVALDNKIALYLVLLGARGGFNINFHSKGGSVLFSTASLFPIHLNLVSLKAPEHSSSNKVNEGTMASDHLLHNNSS